MSDYNSSYTGAEIDEAIGKVDETFTSAEKTKLSGIEIGAEVNQSASDIKTAYESNDDTNAYTDTEKTKLSNIAESATANSSDATLLNRANHTGTQTADTITDGITNKAYTATEKTKLSGIEIGATANDTDANLKNRANHTGTQTASTISDFSTATDARITASDKISSDVTGVTGADQVTNVISLTQAEYDNIVSPNASTLYVITD